VQDPFRKLIATAKRLGLSEMTLPAGPAGRGRAGEASAGEGPSVDSAGPQQALGLDGPSLDADLAWHLRAWGRWVLARARANRQRFSRLGFRAVIIVSGAVR
jgi:hypothetical protein